MGQPEEVSRKDLLVEEVVAAVKVLVLLEEMAPALLQINAGAAETAALVQIRVRERLTQSMGKLTVLLF
jgi:hypothetical protein